MENGELCLNIFELFERSATLKEKQCLVWLVVEDGDGIQKKFGPIRSGQLEALFNPAPSSSVDVLSLFGEQPPLLTNNQIKGMVSETLGIRYVKTLLEQHPGSWLNGEGLVASIVRRGIEGSFFHLCVPPVPITLSVWTQYEDDPSAARWLQDVGGCALVTPILEDFGREGIQWLIDNQPDLANSKQISALPAYFDRASEALNALNY